MSRWYLDTSAALKLLVTEAETGGLVSTIDSQRPDFVACYLLETELRRAVWRYPELTQADATAVLDAVSLYDVPPSLFREAGLLADAGLRSPDALHLAAAIRLGVDSLLAYDHRLIRASRHAGVPTISPGWADEQ